MPQPKVSIIVPVYNAEKYLKRCVNSLTGQTLREIEILLVDDSSTDGSLEVCSQLAREDSRIQVLHKINEGAGKARNAALEIATGEYLGFVDSDDYVEPDMFQTLYEKALEYDSDLVLSGVLFEDGNMFRETGHSLSKNYFSEDTLFISEEERKKLAMGIIGATAEDADDSRYGMSIWKNLFRMDVIRRNQITFQSEREILSEDALFMVDYITCIQRAVGVPQAFYHYCRNGDSISKSYKKDRFEKSLIFVNEVEKRFQRNIQPKEYQIYIHRFWQAMCRVVCSQEILHSTQVKGTYADLRQRLKAVCTHPLTLRALTAYPIGKLPLKQRIFAYAMKYRQYFLLKILVGFRSK